MIVAIFLFSFAFLFALLSLLGKKLSFGMALSSILTLLASALYCYFQQLGMIYPLLSLLLFVCFLLLRLKSQGDKHEF